jgi:hypothetical protein
MVRITAMTTNELAALHERVYLTPAACGDNSSECLQVLEDLVDRTVAFLRALHGFDDDEVLPPGEEWATERRCVRETALAALAIVGAGVDHGG